MATTWPLVALATGLVIGAGAARAEEATPAAAGDLAFPLRFSGYFWVDTGFMARKNAQEGQYDQDASYMQGRFVLAATYKRELGSFFAAARVELMGLVNEYSKSQYEPHTLDGYVMVGQKRWDVEVGRFLAWELYYRGQGIELFTAEEAGVQGAPTMYLLDFTRGYKNEAGQAAVHWFPLDFLSFEIAGVYGQESNQNNFGVRPLAVFRRWGLELAGGYELLKQVPQTEADKVSVTSQGYGGRLQYSFPYVTVGANVTKALVDYLDIQGLVDGDKSLDKTSAGAFLDIDFWKNSIGLGYHRTIQKNYQGETNIHHQAFVSYLLRLPIEGLSLKAVLGYATAHIEDIDTRSSWDNSLNSFRLRIQYEFK